MSTPSIGAVMDQLRGLPTFDSTDDMREEVVDILENANFEVATRVRIPDRGDGRKGYINIVGVRGGESIAVELDRVSPRKASLMKLAAFKPTKGVILLRYGPLRVIEVFHR